MESTSFGLLNSPIQLNKHAGDKLAKNSSSLSECNKWLPYAAKAYSISPNIADYILVPCPVIITGIPNTKGDSISLEQFLKFDTELGMQTYKSFRGKGCYLEHQNNKKDNLAKGIILDAHLSQLKNHGGGRYWKLVLLLAFDRTKDPVLAEAILTKKINTYSMGFRYLAYTCSICGIKTDSNQSPQCTHTNVSTRPYVNPEGRLVYRKCLGIQGFETSAVANPAFAVAIGPKIIDPRAL